MRQPSPRSSCRHRSTIPSCGTVSCAWAARSLSCTSPRARSSGPMTTASRAPRALASSSCLPSRAPASAYSVRHPPSRNRWASARANGPSSGVTVATKMSTAGATGRHEAPILQQLAEHHVAHSEADRGKIGPAESAEQRVVPSAAADGPEMSARRRTARTPCRCSRPVRERSTDRNRPSRPAPSRRAPEAPPRDDPGSGQRIAGGMDLVTQFGACIGLAQTHESDPGPTGW